jgi:hypothetical protein
MLYEATEVLFKEYLYQKLFTQLLLVNLGVEDLLPSWRNPLVIK